MALETKVILKSMYGNLLKAKTLEEARLDLRTMMDAEDVAYVEKIHKENLKKD